MDQLAPDFELPDLGGRSHRLSGLRGRIVVINFWSCECPHSERTDRSLQALQDEWRGEMVVLWIASNRNESDRALKKEADARHIPTILRDADCSIADLYQAQTTPHVYVVDRAGILRYRGAVDDVTFRQPKPARLFLEQAVRSLLEGQVPPHPESPSYGCTIVREI